MTTSLCVGLAVCRTGSFEPLNTLILFQFSYWHVKANYKQ